MLKFVRNIQNNICIEVFDGTDTTWAVSQGFEEKDVEQAYTGEWYLKGHAPALPLEDAVATKYTEILTGANTLRELIRAKYSLPEQDSFIQQEEGARAILADPEALEPALPVHLVRNLAQTEGVSATEFAQRIMNNVTQAAGATEAILLQQRVFETALKKAKTVEEVEAVEVEYQL